LGAPLGTDVVLECHVEACPKAFSYWMKNRGEMLIDGLGLKNRLFLQTKSFIIITLLTNIYHTQPRISDPTANELRIIIISRQSSRNPSLRLPDFLGFPHFPDPPPDMHT
jgi:hypothetical protein